MKLPEIIGISGTHGAGKDTLALLRYSQEGAQYVSLSDILRKELALANLSPERERMMALSKKWREESGDYGILATKTIQNYLGERATLAAIGLSIVSVRHPEEARRIKEHQGIVLWIDGNPKLRYERIQQSSRGRIDDQKTYEEFIAEERKEFAVSSAKHGASVDLGAVRALADDVVDNDFPTESQYLDYLKDRYAL